MQNGRTQLVQLLIELPEFDRASFDDLDLLWLKQTSDGGCLTCEIVLIGSWAAERDEDQRGSACAVCWPGPCSRQRGAAAGPAPERALGCGLPATAPIA